jgi:hypothetical protein
MTRNAGRIVDGLKLVKAPKTRNAENWRVESVRSVVSVSAASMYLQVASFDQVSTAEINAGFDAAVEA